MSIAVDDATELDSAPTDLSSGIELNTDGGNDAYLYNTDAGTLLSGLSQFTFESTFSSNALAGDETALISYATSTDSNEILLNFQPDGRFGVAVAGSVFFTTDSYAHLFDGDVHTVSLSWDNTNGDVAIYVDGELVHTETNIGTGQTIDGGAANGTIVFGNEQDSLGGAFATNEVFAGTLYDVRIWNEVRSEAEIALNYQHKFDSGSLPSGLIANWQMDGFNGSSQVEDVVSTNHLSIGHASGAGFSTSTPVDDLHIAENATNGTSVGSVLPSTPDSPQDVVTDGSFTDHSMGSSFSTVLPGNSFGGWTAVDNNVIVLNHPTYEASPLGGRSVELGSLSGASGITQTLPTQDGRQYQVVFAMSGDWSGPDDVKTVRIDVGGDSENFSMSQPDGWSQTNRLWEQRSFTFTATDASTPLSLTALDLPDNRYQAIVADIQVIEIPQAVSTILNNDPTLSYDAATGKFYQTVSSGVTWDAARANAEGSVLNGVSGQLVTIDSAYENELVRTIAADIGSRVHLGGTDATSDGTWNWIENGAESDNFWNGDDSGSAVNGFYTNFEAGEPNGGTGENSLVLKPDSGEWVDISASGPSYGYVIEWDASEVLSNFTFSLTDDAGGRFAIDSSTGELTVADGSLLDYETATSHNVTVEVTDAGGNTYSEAMSIAIDDGFEISQTVPAAQVTTQDTPLTFTGANAITVSDGLATGDTRLQVYISTGFNGTLTLSQTTGITIGGGSNGGTFMTIQGSESDINAAFDGMTFTPAGGYTGPVTINMTTSLGADLEGRYEFEGDANDTGLGLVQHGTLNGATITNDATRGDVLLLDAANEHVEIASLFGTPSDVTLSAWVNLDSGIENAEIISLGNNIALRADDTGQGFAVFYYQGSGVWNLVGSTDVNLDGTGWNHVAATFDDTNDRVTVYLNGEEVASLHTTDSIDWTDDANTSASTFIGKHGNGRPRSISRE